MDHDDTADNIFPLFDGLDTTPFGAPKATPAARTDHGWSAEPEPTITDDAPSGDPTAPPPATPPRRRLARRAGPLPLSRAAVWLAAALVSGAALASARSMLAPTEPTPRSASPTTHPLPATSHRAAVPAKVSSPTPDRDRRQHANRATHRTQRHASPTKTIVQVRYVTRPAAPVASNQSAASDPSQSAAPAPSPPASTTPSPASGTPASSGSGSGSGSRGGGGSASSASNSPSNPPAFGANGTLAPGHSPDG